MDTATTDRATPAARARRRHRAAVAAAATGSAVALGLVARALAVELVVDMDNGQPPMEIGVALIGGFSLAASLAGWATLAALERWTPRASSSWTVLATAVFVLSLIPIPLADAAGDVKVLLTAIHVAVAVVLIVGLRRSAHSRVDQPRHHRPAVASS